MFRHPPCVNNPNYIWGRVVTNYEARYYVTSSTLLLLHHPHHFVLRHPQHMFFPSIERPSFTPMQNSGMTHVYRPPPHFNVARKQMKNSALKSRNIGQCSLRRHTCNDRLWTRAVGTDWLQSPQPVAIQQQESRLNPNTRTTTLFKYMGYIQSNTRMTVLVS
jgi:hypothetical protein